MNQELKQRLIGAVVVTALAAIFIPMMFDDPVENSGQSISELAIPETPVNTGEKSANKLPTSANQVLNAPEPGSETEVNTEEEAELSANNEPPQDPSLDDEPIVDSEEGVVQSGDVSETGHSSKLESARALDETNKPVNAKKTLPETESSKEKSTQKPLLGVDSVDEAPKKPINKTDMGATKPVTKQKPLAIATDNNTEKSVVKPAKPKKEFSRWYLQAGSFSVKENAISLMETMRKQGLPVTLETTKGAGNVPLYRLKVGPALEKKRAAEMKAKLDSQKIQSILIAE